jgi:hypothetical protein
MKISQLMATGIGFFVVHFIGLDIALLSVPNAANVLGCVGTPLLDEIIP